MCYGYMFPKSWRPEGWEDIKSEWAAYWIGHEERRRGVADAFDDGGAAMLELLGRTGEDRKLAEKDRADEMEKKLRTVLWQYHPCPGKYGDDGELQCADMRLHPILDFKRMPLQELERELFEFNLRRVSEKMSEIKYKPSFEDTVYPDSISDCCHAKVELRELPGGINFGFDRICSTCKKKCHVVNPTREHSS